MWVRKLFSLTKGVRWFGELWYLIRVFVWEICSKLTYALLIYQFLDFYSGEIHKIYPSQLEPPKHTLALERKLPIEKTMLWHQILVRICEKGLWALEKKILLMDWMVVLLNLKFSSISYVENITMFNFVLVLRNLLGCWN
jgi:hypothetical protein